MLPDTENKALRPLKHCKQVPKTLPQDSQSTALDMLKHCSRGYRTLLCRSQSIALYSTEHCSARYGAMLYQGYNKKRCLLKNAGTFYNYLLCDYSAIQMVTRFRSFSANGCTREPLLSFVIRSAGMLYFSVRRV